MTVRLLRAWLVRLAGLFTASRRDAEFERELLSHLQLHIDDNLRAGMTPDARGGGPGSPSAASSRPKRRIAIGAACRWSIRSHAIFVTAAASSSRVPASRWRRC